jgi:predicted nucleic acid-binding protein
MVLTTGNRYLLDTTVFIDSLSGRGVARSILFQAQAGSESGALSAGYSVYTEAELWAGIRPPWTVEEHKRLLRPFRRYLLSVSIARRAGDLQARLRATQQAREPIPQLSNCIIAATGEYYGLTVCTRNSRHFAVFQAFGISVTEYVF